MKIHSGVESRTAPSNQNGSAEHRERPSEGAESAARAKRTQETYTTGDMARLSNNTLRTVRFYEEAGILTPLGRTDGGHRVFERSELERLLLVTDMREAGFSLEQIRDLLEVKQRATSGGAAATQALKSLRGHIEDLRVKVEVLNRLAADLESTAQSASACLECKNPDLFPANCKSCARISDRENVPRGMRVLWSLSGLEPHADAAATEAPPQEQATTAAKKARA